MASFIVEGGRKLSGTIKPQGAKNEALQILCATVLTQERVVVSNLPDILDIQNLLKLIEKIGSTVERLGDDTYALTAKRLNVEYINSEDFVRECARLRGSVMLIGALISRLGEVSYAKPGGDKIGRRRLDTHFIGIQNLGADFHYDERRKVYVLKAPKEGLKGRICSWMRRR